MNKQFGKFYVSFKHVDDRSIAPVLAEMEFVPFRVEGLAYRGVYEYIGTSPMFDEVPCGEITPEYNIIVNDLSDGHVKVSVEKVK